MNSSPPTRLFLIRHGEVEGAGLRLHGHVDVALTAHGHGQLAAVAERLREEPFAAVYCSDLQRARFGAEQVAAGRGIPVVEDPAFRELDMGRWDGRLMAELWREERTELQGWWDDLVGFTLPGGESVGALRRRVLPALERLVAQHRGETVALVAHGGTNRVILFEALGMDLARFHALAQDYACVNRLEYFPDGNTVVKLVNG
ncbi:MAG: histidine phosphatase family protein [Deferrisomatales bacterium]|nr:histidine phosphatase family protein [Deferrisomatales bacterium]